MPSQTTQPVRVLTNEVLTGATPFSFTTTAARIQNRKATNCFYLESDRGFGGTSTGSIKLEGRLSEDASFALVQDASNGGAQIEIDADQVIFPLNTVSAVQTPSLYEQRWTTDDLVPQASGDFILNAWIFQ